MAGKMTRAQKIQNRLDDLNKVRKRISDYTAIMKLVPEDSKEPAQKILDHLIADRDYMITSLVNQGKEWIIESGKVEAFVNALPTILK